jgi:hypothetical protein
MPSRADGNTAKQAVCREKRAHMRMKAPIRDDCRAWVINELHESIADTGKFCAAHERLFVTGKLR